MYRLFKYLYFNFPHFLIAEKSTSIAHLVDNELPLAIVPSTSEDGANTAVKNDVEEAEVGCIDDEMSANNPNNLSGSYNNLFRENSTLSNISSLLNKNAINDDSRMQICYIDEPQKMTENVYSNIPNSSVGSPNPATDHVYSNIDEEKIISTKKNSLKPAKTSSKYPVDGDTMSFMTNDLDLDDPLQCSFIKNTADKLPPAPLPPTLPNDTKQNIYNTNSHNEINPKLILPSISSSSSTTGTQITSIELKNVLNGFGSKTDGEAKQTQNNQSSSSPDNNPATSTLSSSRLRLLQEQTMIDTALDLDSLDGSSIGNNSQSCLVNNKSAIV